MDCWATAATDLLSGGQERQGGEIAVGGENTAREAASASLVQCVGGSRVQRMGLRYGPLVIKAF